MIVSCRTLLRITWTFPNLRLALAMIVAVSCFNGLAVGFPLISLLPPPTGPYASARPGDGVAFKSTAAAATIKRSVTNRTAFSITIRHESDGKSPPVDHRIEFTGPKVKGDVVVEVVGTGKETLKIAGQKYECKWTKLRITYPGQASLTAPRAPIIILRKKWVCQDVALDGEIKSEVEMDGHRIGWEMTGFRRGK
jgi:hypothetical protein